MSQAFTTTEYAIILHLKTEGRGTVPTIAADLLLRPSEVETAIAGLMAKGVLKKEGEFYVPDASCADTPNPHVSETTRRLGAGKCNLPAPAAASPVRMADVSNVFKQARDRAKREKASGGI